MPLTFKGGIHPEYSKQYTFASPIEKLKPGLIYIYPLSQHVGTPCLPRVKVGDRVKIGQVIADSDTSVSAPVHATVSGTVKAIEPRYVVNGFKADCIVVENDFNETVTEQLLDIPAKNAEELSPEEIIKIAKDAGLVGMGGAAFPTHSKMRSALEKKISTLIINGAECEPFITADHRAMIEYPRPIINGVKMLMRCFGLKEAVIAVEDNKKDAIVTLKSITAGTGIKIVSLKTKYPQGGEKQLIRAILGFELPPGKLPTDVGCAVFNVDTCASLFRAYTTKLPLTQRVVTVSGDKVKLKKNLLVKIGTPISELFDSCGGLKSGADRIIMGGPMMGYAQHTLDTPIVKGSSAVLALGYDPSHYMKSQNCIRCGRCVSVCPARLLPNYINLYVTNGMMEECERLNIMDCIECGSCAYICPQRLYIVQSARLGKEYMRKKQAKERAENGK